jgi:hypothetical protein
LQDFLEVAEPTAQDVIRKIDLRVDQTKPADLRHDRITRVANLDEVSTVAHTVDVGAVEADHMEAAAGAATALFDDLANRLDHATAWK